MEILICFPEDKKQTSAFLKSNASTSDEQWHTKNKAGSTTKKFYCGKRDLI